MRRSCGWLALGLIGAAFAGCGSSSTKTKTGAAGITIPQGQNVTVNGRPSVAATQAQVEKWLPAWCRARPGMTKQQLYAVMGLPTTDFPPDSSSWEGFGYQFIAFFDERGKVRLLNTNDVQMTAAQKARVHCAKDRRA